MKNWAVIKGVLRIAEIEPPPQMNVNFDIDYPDLQLTSLTFQIQDFDWVQGPAFDIFRGTDGQGVSPCIRITIEVAE